MDEWIKKMSYTHRRIYTHNGILFSHEKEGPLATFDLMDGPWGHYAKWNKTDRERQIPYDLTNMLNQKNK